MPMEAPKLVLCLMIFVAAVTLVATRVLPLGIAFVVSLLASLLVVFVAVLPIPVVAYRRGWRA